MSIQSIRVKLPKKKNPALQSLNAVMTAHDDPRISMVKITPSQGLKQSKHYQTGDVSYAVELYVPNNDTDIQKGILRAENIVENALGEKLPQMSQILDSLAESNK